MTGDESPGDADDPSLLARVRRHSRRGVHGRPCLGVGRRLLDAIIIVGGEDRIAPRGEQINLQGKDVIVVQTKAHRLGMYLMGQAFFSRVLIEDRFEPRSVRTVALCAADDAELRPIAERFGIEVVVDDPSNPQGA